MNRIIVFRSDAIDDMNANALNDRGGRDLWYTTSQLLFGTILYHQLQVDLVFGK